MLNNLKHIESVFYYIHFTSSMIPISIKKCIFVLLILNQMSDIYASTNQEYEEEVSIDTKYAVENINLTWRIANYSQIFDTVFTQFSQNHSSTTWILFLKNNRILLRRFDTGEPVFVTIHLNLISSFKSFTKEKQINFHCPRLTHAACPQEEILNLEETGWTNPIVFENDVFVLKMKMKILGPVRSKIVRA